MSRRKQSCPQHLHNSPENKSHQLDSSSTEAEEAEKNLNSGESLSPHLAGQSELPYSESPTEPQMADIRSVPKGFVDLSKVKMEPIVHEQLPASPASSPLPNNMLPGFQQYAEMMYKVKEAMKSNHNTRKHKCNNCGIAFTNKTTYNVHVKHYCQGRPNNFQCNLCDAKFPKIEMLKIHAKSHVTSYTCTICSSSFLSPEECELHITEHTILPSVANKNEKNLVLTCGGCNVGTRNLADLMVHMWSKHVKLSPASGDKAPLTSNLPPHNDDLHNTSKESLSGKDLNVSSLPKPISTSTPTRPLSANAVDSMYSCIVCNVAFVDIVNLQRHLLTTHSSPGPLTYPSLRTNLDPQHTRGEKDAVLRPHKRPGMEMCVDSNPEKKSKLDRNLLENFDNRRCVECAITFSNSANYKAHKQFYCASRHTHTKRQDTSNNDGKSAKKEFGKQKKDFAKKIKSRSDAEGSHDEDDNAAYRPALTPTVASKKYFCHECNIGFSKHDTYLAHKKYYCASRRKEKSIVGSTEDRSFKDSNTEKETPSPVISSDNVTDAMSSYINGLQMSQLQALKKYFNAPDCFPNSMSPDLLNPMSSLILNPLLFNQYLSWFQQQTSFAGKSKPTNNTLSSPSSLSPGSLSEPNGKSDDRPQMKYSIRSQSTSPLDLSKKLEEDSKRRQRDVVLDADGKPCPLIDLRKTSFKYKENSNGNNNTEERDSGRRSRTPVFKADFDLATTIAKTMANSTNRLQHCRNCDAQFASLSTFVAHKKFYCPGNLPIRCNSTKTSTSQATLAH